MKKIRVLQLGGPLGLYGAERWILALVSEFQADLLELWVGAVKDDPLQHVQLCREADKLGVKTVIFECNGKFDIFAIFSIRKFLVDNKIDIVHSHGYKTNFISMISSIFTGCKLITTPHGWTNAPGIKLMIYELLDRVIFNFFDAVVPLSKKIYDQLEVNPFLLKKLHFIQNGVDVKEIEEIAIVNDDVRTWKMKGFLVIGYIGRLTEGKGLDVLLNALATLEMSSWKLAIVGDGESEHDLKALCERLNLSGNVTFFGYRTDRLTFLKGFDIFVLPSKSEGIPRCLMEAMVARVPIVASDIPGCRYLVENYRTGYLFESNNAEDLNRSLCKAILDCNLNINIVDAAYLHVCENFSAKSMATKYEMLYKRIVRQ